MATFILAALIFGSAGYILYRLVTGKSNSCDSCQSSCPVKKK